MRLFVRASFSFLLFPAPYTKEETITMDKEQEAYFKARLGEQLDELLAQANDTVNDMTEPKENFPDPTDRASHESNRNFELRIRDREHKLIKKIKEAMERLDNGTYGVCETCGEDISIERLKARPVTTQCIACKTKAEKMEKALGV